MLAMEFLVVDLRQAFAIAKTRQRLVETAR